MWHLTNAGGTRNVAVRWIGPEQQTQPCGHSITHLQIKRGRVWRRQWCGRDKGVVQFNNYNGSVMLAWQANMDLLYVLNAYAYIMYVASYSMKTDRAMGVLLKHVAAEARTEELQSQMKKVGSAFLTQREVSAQEAVYRLLSLPMKQLSRSVAVVDTNPKNDRIAVLKD